VRLAMDVVRKMAAVTLGSNILPVVEIVHQS
jgi:hypothetical protein